MATSSDAASSRSFAYVRRWLLLQGAYFSLAIPPIALVLLHPKTLSGFAVLIGAWAAFYLAIYLYVLPRMQLKFDASVRQQAVRDHRPYLLLLRSFNSSVLSLGKSSLPFTHNALSNFVDAVPEEFAIACIGAGETIRGLLIPASCVPLQSTELDWYDVFLQMAEDAQAIVMTPDATLGCVRELRALAADLALLNKTLVWIPDAPDSRDWQRVRSAWERARRQLSAEFAFPEAHPRGVLYRPNADFSSRVEWFPQKGKLKDDLAEALAEIPYSQQTMSAALLKLDRSGLRW